MDANVGLLEHTTAAAAAASFTCLLLRGGRLVKMRAFVIPMHGHVLHESGRV